MASFNCCQLIHFITCNFHFALFLLLCYSIFVRVNYHLIFLYVDFVWQQTRINGQKRGNPKILFQAKVEKEEFKNKKKDDKKGKQKYTWGFV